MFAYQEIETFEKDAAKGFKIGRVCSLDGVHHTYDDPIDGAGYMSGSTLTKEYGEMPAAIKAMLAKIEEGAEKNILWKDALDLDKGVGALTLEWLRSRYKGGCDEAVAIWLFLTSRNFEDCLRRSRTVGIAPTPWACALSAAYHGVSSNLLKCYPF